MCYLYYTSVSEFIVSWSNQPYFGGALLKSVSTTSCLHPKVYRSTNKRRQIVHSDSDSILRRTLLAYYADGMHANC